MHELGRPGAGGQRDEPRLFVHLADNVQRTDAARFARVEEADLYTFFRQGQPRIDIGRIVIEIDEDIVIFFPRQTRGDEAKPQRGRTHKGNFIRLRIKQAGRQLASMPHLESGRQFLLIATRAKAGVLANRFRNATRQRTDTRMSEKDRVARDRKFVLPKPFVGKQVGQRHA